MPKDDTGMKRPPRIAVQMQLHWPLKRHTAIYHGIQAYSDEHGWQMTLDDFVARHGDSEERDGFPYDGIIGRIDGQLAELANRRGIPVVNVWYGSPARQSVPGVFSDATALGRLAAEHLLGRGYRRFAALPRTDPAETAAAQAFHDAVRQAGFKCAVDAVHLDCMTAADRYAAAMRTIDAWIATWKTPVGIFVPADAIDRIVVQACRNRGVRVPLDAAIVSGEDEEAFCLRPRPAITGIDRGYKQIGQAAAALLDELLRQSPRDRARGLPPRHILMPPLGVLPRESTDFFAVDDPVVTEAVAYIKSNAHRDIGQEDVARAVAISARALQMRFRKVLARPIAATIRLVRLDKAGRELVQGERALAAIARDAGFGTTARMNIAFRAEMGVTANAYRRQWRRTGPAT